MMRSGSGAKLLFLLLLMGFSTVAASAQNSISGIVFDENRRPVDDIEVELLDQFERLIGTRKTRGSGFYTFQRLNAGIYYLRVRVAGTGFKDAKERIDLGDLNSIGGVDQKQHDIFLERDTPSRDRTTLINEVVFAQEVPNSAKASYERGRRLLEEGKYPEAEAAMIEALNVFPDYLLALEGLGDVYLRTKYFANAVPVFEKALDVNPRCFGCFFNLAVAQNNLGKKDEAVGNLEKANDLDPGSINSHLLMGIILRDLKRFNDAESALLRAKELSANEAADVNWQLAALYYYDLKRPSEAAVELERYIDNLSSKEKRENRAKIDGVRKLIKQIREGS